MHMVLAVLLVLAVELLRYGNNGEFRAFRRAQFHVIFWTIAINVFGCALIYLYNVKARWARHLRSTLVADGALSTLPFLLAVLLHNSLHNRDVRSFGLVLAIFAFGKCAVWTRFACWNANLTDGEKHLRLYIFLVSLIVFCTLAPWYRLTITPVGDELHSTLLTYSLIHDHDFDLSNNYANLDFVEQWPPPTPIVTRSYGLAAFETGGVGAVKREPHVVTNFRGQKMLWHDIGIPILLVPGYALAKRLGVVLTVGLVASLLAVGIFEISLLLKAKTNLAIIVSVLFTFTQPLYIYSQTAYPEIFGATGIIWTAACFLQFRESSDRRLIVLAGLITAILPWICVRFWVLAGLLFLVFTAYIVRMEWGRWSEMLKTMFLISVPSIIGLGIFAWFDHTHFNSYLPNAGYRIVTAYSPQFFAKPYQGFLGMFFDRTYGLLPTAPLYVAAAAGFLVLLRHDRWAAAVLSLPCFGYIGFMSFSQFWTGGWSPPARYVIAGLVLLVPTVALVLNRRAVWILAGPALWTLVISMIFTVDSFTRWPSPWKGYMGSGLLDLFEDKVPLPRVGSPFGLYPSMLRGPAPREYAVACAWLVTYVCLAFWLARTAGRARLVSRADLPQ